MILNCTSDHHRPSNCFQMPSMIQTYPNDQNECNHCHRSFGSHNTDGHVMAMCWPCGHCLHHISNLRHVARGQIEPLSTGGLADLAVDAVKQRSPCHVSCDSCSIWIQQFNHVACKDRRLEFDAWEAFSQQRSTGYCCGIPAVTAHDGKIGKGLKSSLQDYQLCNYSYQTLFLLLWKSSNPIRQGASHLVALTSKIH